MRESADPARSERAVGVDTAIPQKGPVPAYFFQAGDIALGVKNLLPVLRGLGEHHPEGVTNKGSAEKLQATPGGPLMPDPVDGSDIKAVGDRVRALDGLPGVVLHLAVLPFFRRMPADRGGIKKHLRPPQRHQPRRLGIPLIPADQRPDASKLCVKREVTVIAGGEVVLLVIQRVVGNVGLAVDIYDRAVRVNNSYTVVIHTRRSPLKQGGYDGDAPLARDAGNSLGRRSGDRLRQIKQRRVLPLAKIL